MKLLYFECSMGAAGDMLMSALYEICREKELFLKTMNEAFAPFSVTLSAACSVKCGITGTHITVRVDGEEEGHSHSAAKRDVHPHHGKEHGGHSHASAGNDAYPDHSSGTENSAEQHTSHDHNHHHADYQSILSRIGSMPLSAQVKKDAAAIYQLIAEAEARVHDTDLQHIHFHEVGSLDALADVVGCAVLIHMIAPDQILCSPIHAGSGFVRCAHGILPVPAPATAELLKGIPYYTGTISSELCTPTGAAVLKHFAEKFLPMPAMMTESVGYGMGTKDFAAANCVRAFLGERYEEGQAACGDDPEDGFQADDSVLSISCNIDDMTGEALGLATEIMLSAGALDVFTIPVQMKKNRPGILLTCLCERKDQEKFTALFFLHTTTRGVRYQIFERAKLDSEFENRNTPYGKIRMKKSSGYGIAKEKPEFEDVKEVILKNHCSISVDDVTKSIR